MFRIIPRAAGASSGSVFRWTRSGALWLQTGQQHPLVGLHKTGLLVGAHSTFSSSSSSISSSSSLCTTTVTARSLSSSGSAAVSSTAFYQSTTTSWRAFSTMDRPIRRRKKRIRGQEESPIQDTAAAHVDAEQGDDNDDDDAAADAMLSIRHEAVMNPERFAVASHELLNKLETALTPLGRFNDPFSLLRGHEEDLGDYLLMDLGPTLGQYTIQVDLEQKVVMMQSPISGRIAYILSASTGEWRGSNDGHVLEGLLVRDLTRQVQGLPNL